MKRQNILIKNFLLKFVTNEGTIFTFKTNYNAPKYKLVTVDLSHQNPKWRLLVAEKDDVLESVRCVNQTKLLLTYMHDCKVILIS